MKLFFLIIVLVMLSNCLMSHNFLNVSLLQIEGLLEQNFTVICELEKRVENLVELSQKIAQQMRHSLSKNSIVENCSPQENFMRKVFGKTEYNYVLTLDEPLKKSLCKDRIFNIDVGLYDKQQKRVCNSNKIPLVLSVYTCSQQPRLITTNKCGEPILRGQFQTHLHRGKATFFRISIRQVSGKYQNKLVTLVAYVNSPPLMKDFLVDENDIRPLIIRNVRIVAKKQE